jgi:hypothetical protein
MSISINHHRCLDPSHRCLSLSPTPHHGDRRGRAARAPFCRHPRRPPLLRRPVVASPRLHRRRPRGRRVRAVRPLPRVDRPPPHVHGGRRAGPPGQGAGGPAGGDGVGAGRRGRPHGATLRGARAGAARSRSGHRRRLLWVVMVVWLVIHLDLAQIRVDRRLIIHLVIRIKKYGATRVCVCI